MAERLEDIAARMVAPGKGLLAADESNTTIAKRFEAAKIPNTEEARRDYREMLFRTKDAMEKHISGVILYDETIRQKAKDGTTLVDVIKAAGAVPGIKVDKGAWRLALAPGEKITEGLDNLRDRLVEYHNLGARFAKWRGVIDIADGIPTDNGIHANAHALARYAALCQENGIVPIVEPEVLMDGPVATHDADTCYAVSSPYAPLGLRRARPRQRLARRHDPEAEHGHRRQECQEAGLAGRSGREDASACSRSACRRRWRVSPSFPAASPMSRQPSTCR